LNNGGYDRYDGGGEQISYVGATGVFAAWADSATGECAAADMGTCAGKRQSQQDDTLIRVTGNL
jgi:hypothetical protein